MLTTIKSRPACHLLDVAVDDTLLWRVLDGRAHAAEEREPLARAELRLVAILRDGQALHQFHDEERPPRPVPSLPGVSGGTMGPARPKCLGKLSGGEAIFAVPDRRGSSRQSGRAMVPSPFCELTGVPA